MRWEPCEVRFIGDMVSLWNRFINMSDLRLTKHIFIGVCQKGILGPDKLRSKLRGIFFSIFKEIRCNIKQFYF